MDVTNARIEWIEKKKNALKAQGTIVSPIYSRVYWYNNQCRLDDVQQMHKDAYLKVLTKEYFALVKQIYRYPAVFTAEQFKRMGQDVRNNYSTTCAEMLNYYGYLWHVSQ